MVSPEELRLAQTQMHASVIQALAATASTLISAAALLYAVRSLRAAQQQTTETFRPIIEVLGGEHKVDGKFRFVNKGNGPALNFRWRIDEEPERWRSYNTNVIASKEEGDLSGTIEWPKGLVLSYNSVAHADELLTYVQFSLTGAVSNRHKVNQGVAVTRLGWTLLDPSLAIPAFHPDLIASMSFSARVKHWWRIKRGKERRL